MASASRLFARSLRSSAPSFRPIATRQSRFITPAPAAFRQQWQRGYASGKKDSEPKGKKDSVEEGNPTVMLIWAGALVTGCACYGLYLNNPELFGKESKPFVPSGLDYQQVYNMIAKRLEEHDDYDDGSYGPVLLRLAWHCSGTYDKETNTGGSNGATMRFAPESDHGANAGLKAARDFLEPVKQAFPWITYSDLWILGGVCAIQEMQGPKIPYRAGRSDRDVSFCTPDGRLPDGAKNASHIRAIFGRMGFDDRAMVALSGAHALGRCHTDRSGWTGPWTFSPTKLTNDYFKLLLEEKWQYKKWNGPKQFEDVKTKTLMMLPTDMEIVKDKSFRQYTELYANDNETFFNDFRDAVVMLFELGVPFVQPEDRRYVFRSSFD